MLPLFNYFPSAMLVPVTRSEQMKLTLLDVRATTSGGTSILTSINFGSEVEIDIFGRDSDEGQLIPYSYRIEFSLAPVSPETSLAHGGKLHDLGECNLWLRVCNNDDGSGDMELNYKGFCSAQFVGGRLLIHVEPTRRRYFTI